MANFPTTPATGSYFTTSGTTYKYVSHGTWQVAAPDADVRMNVVQDDHTKLLLKFDGPNNSTNVGFTGSSRHKRVAVPTNAIISTASYVFGTSSAYFDGTGDYLSISDHADFDLGTSDFTIECWVYPENIGSYNRHFLSKGDQTDPNGGAVAEGRSFDADILANGKAHWTSYYDGNNSATLTGTTTLVNNRWYHYAVVREGNQLSLYIDGTLEVTAAFSYTFNDVTAPLEIGAAWWSTDGGQWLSAYQGYIDQMRVSKGIARYSGSFVPNSGSDAFDFTPQPARPADETSNLQTLTLQSSSISIPDAEPTDVKFYVDKPAIDSYTSLLLHFDGGDETTSGAGFVDSSPSSHTVTVTNAKIDNGASVFGTSSAYFDGSGDYLSFADSDDWTLPADFTIEFWVQFDTTVPDVAVIIGAQSLSGEVWRIQRWEGGGVWQFAAGSAMSPYYSFTSTVSADTWYHMAVTRTSGIIRFYQAGTQIGSDTASNTTTLNNPGVYIGRDYTAANYMDGWLDEFRITKGIARYTSNFDPPKKQFGKPDLKLKDSSGTYTIKLKQIN